MVGHIGFYEPFLYSTHLILKSSAASLALSICKMSWAFPTLAKMICQSRGRHIKRGPKMSVLHRYIFNRKILHDVTMLFY